MTAELEFKQKITQMRDNRIARFNRLVALMAPHALLMNELRMIQESLILLNPVAHQHYLYNKEIYERKNSFGICGEKECYEPVLKGVHDEEDSTLCKHHYDVYWNKVGSKQ